MSPPHFLELGVFTFFKVQGCSGFTKVLNACNQIMCSNGCCSQPSASGWIRTCAALVSGPNSVSLLSSQVVKVGLVEDSPSATGEPGAPLLLWNEGGAFLPPL